MVWVTCKYTEEENIPVLHTYVVTGSYVTIVAPLKLYFHLEALKEGTISTTPIPSSTHKSVGNFQP